MQTVTIISVGKLKDAFFEMASDEYLKRIKAFAKVNVIEIKAGVLPENPSENEIKYSKMKQKKEKTERKKAYDEKEDKSS